MSFDHDIKVSDGTKAGITLALSFNISSTDDNQSTSKITSTSYTSDQSATQRNSLIGVIYQNNINNIGNY
jgi:hypothetical protein